MNSRATLSEVRPIPRRGLSREEAAMYIGVGLHQFDAMVRAGTMPRPKVVDELRIWDIHELYDHLPEDEEAPLPNEAPNRVPEVYVIGFDQYVKIGYSTSLIYRLRSVQTSVPVPLTLYARFPGNQTDERTLHRRFAALRLQGEWFRHKGKLAAWIKGGCR